MGKRGSRFEVVLEGSVRGHAAISSGPHAGSGGGGASRAALSQGRGARGWVYGLIAAGSSSRTRLARFDPRLMDHYECSYH